MNTPRDTSSDKDPENTPGPLTRLAKDESGSTTLEWALLLAAIALPAFAILQMCLSILVAHYQMTTTLLALPLP